MIVQTIHIEAKDHVTISIMGVAQTGMTVDMPTFRQGSVITTLAVPSYALTNIDRDR